MSEAQNNGYYSPLPPDAYGFEPMLSPRFRGWWNLYWLSDPDLAVDDPHSSAGGDRLFKACGLALTQRVGKMQVAQLLLLPASDFVEMVKDGPYEHLAPYQVRGEIWLSDMKERLAGSPRMPNNPLIRYLN